MINPFVEFDTADFVNDPNFLKLVELYFGIGTKTTYRKEWLESLDEEPASRILLIHVPDMNTGEALERLMRFWELMREMQDYPINLIIDVNFNTREEYLTDETNKACGAVKI